MHTATFPAVSPLFATLQAERVRMGQWAFLAALRLSDQNRPLGLKLIIECLFMFHALIRMVRGPDMGMATAVKAGAPRSAHRPRRHVRSAAVVKQAADVVDQQSCPPLRQASCPASGRAQRANRGRRNRACVQQKCRFLCKVGLAG